MKKPDEKRIGLSDIPSPARSYIEAQQTLFHGAGFRAQGYIQRRFPSGPCPTTQWTIEATGDFHRIFATVFYAKRDLPFTARLFHLMKAEEKNRILKSFFENGCRLMTTDIVKDHVPKENWSPPIYWQTVDPELSLDAMIERHRFNLKKLLSEAKLTVVPIASIDEYEKFSESYPYTAPVTE